MSMSTLTLKNEKQYCARVWLCGEMNISVLSVRYSMTDSDSLSGTGSATYPRFLTKIDVLYSPTDHDFRHQRRKFWHARYPNLR